MKYLKLIALLIPVVMISCSKDDDDNSNNGGNTTLTNTDKLCGKNWKYSKIESDTNGDGVADLDITSQYPACALDNYYTFSAPPTQTVVFNEGPTKCDPNDPQTTSVTWTWLANETQLKWDAQTYTVIVNDGNTLKLRLSPLTITFIK